MVFLFTVISVSVDAYAAGLAYSMGKRLSFVDSLYAGSYTFIMCILAAQLRDYLMAYMYELRMIGGILLVIIGMRYLLAQAILKNSDENRGKKSMLIFEGDRKTTLFGDVTVLGFSVSVDACMAVFSMVGIGAFLSAISMFVFHTMFLWLGSLSARPLSIFEGIKTFSGVFLILLGISRIAA